MEKAVNLGSPILSHFVHKQQWFYNIPLCMFGANLLGQILVSVIFFFTCQYYSLIFRYSFWDCCLKSVAFLMSVSGPMTFSVSFWACRLKSVAVTEALSPRAQVNPVVTSIIGSSEYIRDIASSSTFKKGCRQSCSVETDQMLRIQIPCLKVHSRSLR